MASRSYEIGSLRFGIRTTEGAFTEWMDEVLGAYRVGDEVPAYFSVVVGCSDGSKARSVKEFNILYRGVTRIVRTLHIPTLGRSLLSELERLTFVDRDDAIFVRALPIVSNGTVALVPSNVAEILSDLGRPVRRAGVALPARSAVAIDAKTGALVPTGGLPGVPADALDRLVRKLPGSERSDRFELEEPTKPDVVLTLGSARSAPLLEPASRGQALQSLTTLVMNLHRTGGAALRALKETVSAARCSRLNTIQPEPLLEAVRSALRS
ncbi:MAG: hypothetical protein ACRDJ4_04795 [Actinomycetota bacterium]